MKELKFRQAIFKDGKFIRFHYWGFVGYRNEFIRPINISGINLPYTILESEQYIGQKDNMGKDIFKGDIFKTLKGIVGIIDYHHNKTFYYFKHKNIWGSGSKYVIKSIPWIIKNGEIIGNIHENKELLKD